MRITKVLKNEQGKCILKFSGDAVEDEMIMTLRADNGKKVNFTMNSLDVCYFIDQLLVHNDITIDDVDSTLEHLLNINK